MHMHGLAISNFLAIATVLAPIAALAGEIPAEGAIDSTFTYISTPTTMPSADGYEATVYDASLVLTGNSSASLLDRMAARCLLAGPNNQKSGAFRIAGWCTYSDRDGDMIFASDEESAGSWSEPSKGSGKILGGTGKYAGITGAYTFTNDYFGSPKVGTYAGAGKKSGSYKIVK